jgi:hypothetical protein
MSATPPRARLLVACALVLACGARTGFSIDGGAPPGDGGAGGSPILTTGGTSNGGNVGTGASFGTGGSGGVSEVCALGETEACYTGPPGTAGVGSCREGTRSCTPDGVFGDCERQVLPVTEGCNGLDDDCDGVADEGCGVAEGCADGAREGFVDGTLFPNIAGCAGGFGVPGVLVGLVQTCGGSAGDDSANPSGVGCSAADLCSPGFAVCETEADVAARSPSGCTGITNEPGLFFVTRQSGTGCGTCALGTTIGPVCAQCQCAAGCAPTAALGNDLFGCGTVGEAAVGCGVLDRFSSDFCSQLPSPWTCPIGSCSEALSVSKPGPAGGGVLCCRVEPIGG